MIMAASRWDFSQQSINALFSEKATNPYRDFAPAKTEQLTAEQEQAERAGFRAAVLTYCKQNARG